MDLFTAIEGRRSVRRYLKEDFPEEKLIKVLEAARLAPSWNNLQGWHYIVVKDRALILALGELNGYNPNPEVYENVPCFLVLCCNPRLSGHWEGKEHYLTDAGISLEQAVLAAHSLGLGTCWIGVFPEEETKRLLQVPEELRIVALTPLGIPAQEPKPRPRKPLQEISSLNQWGKPLIK